MHEQARALGSRQIAVLLNEILQQNRNTSEHLSLSRRNPARLAVRPIEPLSDDGVEGGVEGFDAGDRGFADFSRADLAAPYDARETESVMLIVVIDFHGGPLSGIKRFANPWPSNPGPCAASQAETLDCALLQRPPQSDIKVEGKVCQERARGLRSGRSYGSR
jgi:hypothetical protein